jgi:hypothetical protein
MPLSTSSLTSYVKSIITPSAKKEDPKQNQRTTTTSTTPSYVYTTPPQTTKPSGGGTPSYKGGVLTGGGGGTYNVNTGTFGGSASGLNTPSQIPPSNLDIVRQKVKSSIENQIALEAGKVARGDILSYSGYGIDINKDNALDVMRYFTTDFAPNIKLTLGEQANQFKSFGQLNLPAGSTISSVNPSPIYQTKIPLLGNVQLFKQPRIESQNQFSPFYIHMYAGEKLSKVLEPSLIKLGVSKNLLEYTPTETTHPIVKFGYGLFAGTTQELPKITILSPLMESTPTALSSAFKLRAREPTFMAEEMLAKAKLGQQLAFSQRAKYLENLDKNMQKINLNLGLPSGKSAVSDIIKQRTYKIESGGVIIERPELPLISKKYSKFITVQKLEAPTKFDLVGGYLGDITKQVKLPKFKLQPEISYQNIIGTIEPKTELGNIVRSFGSQFELGKGGRIKNLTRFTFAERGEVGRFRIFEAGKQYTYKTKLGLKLTRYPWARLTQEQYVKTSKFIEKPLTRLIDVRQYELEYKSYFPKQKNILYPEYIKEFVNPKFPKKFKGLTLGKENVNDIIFKSEPIKKLTTTGEEYTIQGFRQTGLGKTLGGGIKIEKLSRRSLSQTIKEVYGKENIKVSRRMSQQKLVQVGEQSLIRTIPRRINISRSLALSKSLSKYPTIVGGRGGTSIYTGALGISTVSAYSSPQITLTPSKDISRELNIGITQQRMNLNLRNLNLNRLANEVSLAQIPTLKVQLKEQQQLKLGLTEILKIKTPSPPENPPPTFPIIKIPNKFYLPPLLTIPNLKTKKIKRSNLLKLSTRYRYTPSFSALLLNIKGKKPKMLSKSLGYNPFVIRPLLK